MEELQLSLLEKQLTTTFFNLGAKRQFLHKKWWHHQKNVIALNMYIGTNVLVYERWLVLKVWYTATLSPFHTHIAHACKSKMNNLEYLYHLNITQSNN